ncbi:hypothetical protein GEMRC1_011708 [Eukaryota sp. GEM-RC1]
MSRKRLALTVEDNSPALKQDRQESDSFNESLSCFRLNTAISRLIPSTSSKTPSISSPSIPDEHTLLHQFLIQSVCGPPSFELPRALASLDYFTHQLYSVLSVISSLQGVGVVLTAKAPGFGRKEVVAEVARRLLKHLNTFTEFKDSFSFLHVDAANTNTFSSVIGLLCHQAGVNVGKKTAEKIMNILNTVRINPTLLFIDNADLLLENDENNLFYFLTNIYSQNSQGAVAVVFSSNIWNFAEKLEIRVKSRVNHFLRVPVPDCKSLWDCLVTRLTPTFASFSPWFECEYSSKFKNSASFQSLLKRHNKQIKQIKSKCRQDFYDAFKFSNNPKVLFSSIAHCIRPEPDFGEISNVFKNFNNSDHLSDLIKTAHPEVIEMLMVVLAFTKLQSESFSLIQIEKFLKNNAEVVKTNWVKDRVHLVLQQVLSLNLIEIVPKTKTVLADDVMYKCHVSPLYLANAVRSSPHFSKLKGNILGLSR